MVSNHERINGLLRKMVQQEREQKKIEAEPETNENDDYQDMINRANTESAMSEFLSDLRAMPGREY